MGKGRGRGMGRLIVILGEDTYSLPVVLYVSMDLSSLGESSPYWKTAPSSN